jgi:hypothetical protein
VQLHGHVEDGVQGDLQPRIHDEPAVSQGPPQDDVRVQGVVEPSQQLDTDLEELGELQGRSEPT